MSPFSESAVVDKSGDRTVIVSEIGRNCVVVQGFTCGYDGGRGSSIFLSQEAAVKVADILGRWAARPILVEEPVNVVQQSEPNMSDPTSGESA